LKQADRILNHLRRGQSITAKEAWTLYGVARLAARIKDLRNKGENITTTKIVVKNDYGCSSSIAQYRLEPVSDQLFYVTPHSRGIGRG